LIIALILAASIPAIPCHSEDGRLAAGLHTIRADDSLLQLAEEGGFSWVIQLLEWREVEPVPGEYFWEYADWLVRAAGYYGLDLVLRLDHPPDWAVPVAGGEAVDAAAYAHFVGKVAERYRGRVMAYVIWNEPNLAAEWAQLEPDPVRYVELLCSAQEAIQAADPDALVVSAGLAPTNHDDASALDDRLYLRAMYAQGAALCFDVLGAHGYGFGYPPDDPHGTHEGLNVARLTDLRAIMLEEGDGDRPVWVTEVGWTTDPLGPEQQWVGVSEEEQGSYLVGVFQKASQEWPWIERMAAWNLSTGLPVDDEKRGYSLLEEDGTPKPAYTALSEMAKEQWAKATRQTEGAATGTVEILAPDVAVRLSDVDTYYPHWARPHCRSVPCREWRGQFYIRDPGDGAWQLHMETMQVEELGNLVLINGRLLEPPSIPRRGRPDFASVWTEVAMTFPARLLQPGVNLVEIRSSPRLPVYQDKHAHFESLQFRRLRLIPESD
jgi:hypothetical protein